jgi:hypothetical protein
MTAYWFCRWARRKSAFAHPHMGLLESSIPIGAWVLFLSQGAAAVREAMRSVARAAAIDALRD